MNMFMIIFMFMIMTIFDDGPLHEGGTEIMNTITIMIMNMIMMAQRGARRGPVRRRHGDLWRVKSYNNQILPRRERGEEDWEQGEEMGQEDWDE